MPSGVAFTNLLETLVFRAIARGMFADQGIYHFKIYQNGDDGLYLSDGKLDTERASRYWKQFGLILNAAKSQNDEFRCSYLQRHFYGEDGWRAVMSTNRMLVRILYSERDPGIERTGLRPRDFWTVNKIVKLENCKRHPNFPEFVDFVKRGDEGMLDPGPVIRVS